MTAAWAGLAREAGRAALPSTADLLLNPALTAARILAETPEAIPTLPSFRIPEFADLEPLARAVGADPQAHLAAVQGLATHRADISDAFAAAGIFAAAAAAELANIVGSLIAAVPGAFAAAAPLGPGAQIAAVAALTGKALADAAGTLNNLEEELNRVAQRLAASTAAALAVPLPGGSASGQLATEALAGLARTAQPYAAAAGIQLPPAPVPATVPAAVHRAPAAPVAPPPQVAPAPAAGSSAGAAAVAAAKSQLGTPYVWGGSQPGGFDCSGLTSWAYRQAGVELPRTAASQAVGRQVSYAELQPGDLVLWEGHAAMYAGDGMMIEAGDPVQLNPVRTSNLGMAFLGFWRPTG
ncbi:C40 family peptidase [Corynebacterium bouchesdurhonense]|uniref:C40 family peptidase n=1 Tax=Corynebacterium bouchesdurhonense TaxID=1720192 RepID=UPI000B0B1E36|nr:C40 family peptidase [Corynebacterium bouchesdurhonense]